MTGVIGSNRGKEAGVIAHPLCNMTNMVTNATGGATLTGFSEYTTARGRMVVALPDGGTDAGTVGTALTNQQDPTHTHGGGQHTHGGGQHTHGGGSHTHGSHCHQAGLICSLWGGGFGGTCGWTTLAGVAAGSATTAASSGTTGASSGTTGTTALSGTLSYIQLISIKKDAEN
jgi:hypothetical protein